MVGVAGQKVALGDPVEGHHQLVRLAVLGPVLADAGGQGGDVGRVAVVVVDEAHLRHPAPAAQLIGHGVEHRGRGRARVLGIKRKHQDAPGAGAVQLGQAVGDGGCAVAHGQGRGHWPLEALLQPPLDALLLAAGHRDKRRPLPQSVPHPPVGLGRLGRPGAQNDAVQDGPPHRPRHLHHPRIPQEFGQVAAQRRLGGRLRTAQVDQEDPGALGAAVAVIGLALEAGHGSPLMVAGAGIVAERRGGANRSKAGRARMSAPGVAQGPLARLVQTDGAAQGPSGGRGAEVVRIEIGQQMLVLGNEHEGLGLVKWCARDVP